jgi:hypothetical protein
MPAAATEPLEPPSWPQQVDRQQLRLAPRARLEEAVGRDFARRLVDALSQGLLDRRRPSR